ncbi:MAG TPA: LamG-like jellyroll fold domain-containing protein [Cyclobacteriaceae bacterium]
MKKIVKLLSVGVIIFLIVRCQKEDSAEPSSEDPFIPQNVLAHYTFENTTDDVTGSFDPVADDVIDISYVESHGDSSGTAASFNGQTSLIEIPNGNQFLAHNDFSIAFWIRASSEKRGHFVMGLAGPYGFHFEIDSAAWSAPYKYVKLTSSYNGVDSTAREDQLWNGNGKTKDNGGWQGVNVNKEEEIGPYFADKWAHVVCIYNSATRVNTMFVNGEKVKEFDFNLWPDWDVRKKITGVIYNGNPVPGNKLALGFIQARESRRLIPFWANYADTGSNHFKGLLDDLWIFSTALTDMEARQLYNSEK